MPALQPAAGLLLLVALGCGRSAEAVERERVLAAIDALREASGGDARRRRALLEALERQPALARGSVEARDACGAAYRHLLDGDELADELRRAVERGEGARPDVPRRLHEAEAGVAQARILMPRCERALADLRAARPLP